MQDVRAIINELKNGLEGLGDSTSAAELNKLIFGVLKRNMPDFSCFLTDNDVLQYMLDVIPVPVYFKNNEGVYLACNQALADMYNIGKKDIIGKTVYDFFPEETAENFSESDRVLMRGDTHERIEYRGRLSDRSDSFQVIQKKAFVRNGQVDGVIGVIMDMTEIKKIEDTAWASEAFFKSLYQMSPMPIVIANSLNMIMDMNDSATVMFLPDDVAAGQEISALFPSHRDFEQAMAGKDGLAKVRVNTADGVVEMITMVSTEVLNGEIQHGIAFLRTDLHGTER